MDADANSMIVQPSAQATWGESLSLWRVSLTARPIKRDLVAWRCVGTGSLECQCFLSSKTIIWALW